MINKNESSKAFRDVQKCDFRKFAEFYNLLLNEGIYFSPSQFETNFVSGVHIIEQLENMTKIVKEKVRRV